MKPTFKYTIIPIIIVVTIIIGLLIVLARSNSTHQPRYTLDYKLDTDYSLEALKNISQDSHEFGSENQLKVKNYIIESISSFSKSTVEQSFTTRVPVAEAADTHRFVTGYNIVAKSKLNHKKNCTILIGSHYDTKKLPQGKCHGANDSGSSSVLLMDYLRYLSSISSSDINPECSLTFVWFDGEEAVLFGWNEWKNYPDTYQDNTYGSRYFATQLESCTGKYSSYCLSEDISSSKEEVVAFILFDMVGSYNLRLSRDLNSDIVLQDIFASIWNTQNQTKIYQDSYVDIEDDHIPFVKKRIKSIDIIDLNNIDHWHNDQDNIEYVSMEELAKVAKSGMEFILRLASSPQILYSK